MPQRKYSAASGYRYGFNGKEDDKDISEGGQDYGMRIYDSRLGRFLSVDPLTKSYPWYTPYQYAGNIPIWCIDMDGMEPVPYAMEAGQNYGKTILANKAAKGDKKAQEALNDVINADFKIVCIQFGFALTAASGGAGGTFLLKKMLKGGITGLVVNSSISYLQGDDGYDILKSAVSGFFSGAILGAYSKINSLSGLAIAGTNSGITGEIVEQTFDNTFGNGDGTYNLEKIILSGGVGAVANIVSSKLVDNIVSAIDKNVLKNLKITESKSYLESIKKAIKEETPRITPGVLKKAAKERIQLIQKLIKQQGELEKIALTQAIERTVDYLQEKIQTK